MLKKTLIILLLSLLTCGPVSAQASDGQHWFSRDQAGNTTIHLYFFWSKKCPHCLDARPYVEGVWAGYSWVDVHSHQLVGEKDNVRLYQEMAKELGQDARSVPAFMLCGVMYTGFDAASTPTQIDKELRACREYLQSNDTLQGFRQASDKAELPDISLPLIGSVNPETNSLLFVTVVIAAVDAFNPCAFFVLMFLLSMMLRTGSRSRMLLVGGIFLFFSGFLYFLFMAAWLNLFRVIGELGVITMIAALVAILAGLINVKDFFWFKQGVSLSIPDGAKPKLYERTRDLLKAHSLVTLVPATIALALFANLYEFLCTAGFPMVYTRILTLSELSNLEYYLYLILYNVIYVLPMLVIVIAFAVSLGGRKLQEREGRHMKLISGMMMLSLGMILLIDPNLLHQVGTTMLIIGFAIGIGVVLILLEGRITNSKSSR
jgi:hypothetical protein